MADRDRYALASQLAVLRSCPEVLGRLLKKGGSVLLAAKILVVSRLLHTKLSERASIRMYTDTLRARLAKLRQKLLSHIDRYLKSPHLSSDELVDAMCAYSLATTSSARDVLRHFHHVRSEAICATVPLSGQAEFTIVEALRLWIRTLQDTNNMVPRRLSQALAKLKSTPLFKDPTLWSTKDFNYDIHAQWIGDDLKNFVPYVRHDDLQSSTIADYVTAWAPKTLDAFLNNVRLLLDLIADSAVIIRLRRECLQLWLSNRRNFVGVEKSEVFYRLRKPFRQRLGSLVESDSRALEEVSAQLTSTIRDQNQSTSQAAQTLWKNPLGSANISAGAKTFISSIRDGVYGTDNALRGAIFSYQQWLVIIDRWVSTIKELRSMRWDDDLDDLGGDDDTEDRMDLLLNTDDPQYLERELSRSLGVAFDVFQATADHLTKNIVTDASIDGKAAFILRLLRNVKQHLPNGYSNSDFAAPVVDDLQSAIAASVVKAVVDEHRSSISKATKSPSVRGRALWDGVPELPTLPSPWTFRLLRTLQLTMATAGTDLWSSTAVAKIKILLRQSLIMIFTTENHSESIMNGDERIHSISSAVHETNEDVQLSNSHGDQPADSDIVENDYKIQLFFDMTYLALATSSLSRTEGSDNFEDYLNKIQSEALLVSVSASRVKKSAGEYWKRSSLLFALLI